MKFLSAGCIILNPGIKKFLILHTTNNHFWDIPKGLVEKHEQFFSAAIREVSEETGLVYKPENLRDLGRFTYTPDKDLYLFLIHDFKLTEKSLPSLKCFSTFETYNGRRLPECDKYNLITYNEMYVYFSASMTRVFKTLEDLLT